MVLGSFFRGRTLSIDDNGFVFQDRKQNQTGGWKIVSCPEIGFVFSLALFLDLSSQRLPRKPC